MSAYDIRSGEKIAQADISYLFGGRAGNLICELNWSPNSNFVSFNSGCDLGTERTLKEVYVWQLATGDVKRITNFTVDILKDERVPMVAARYKTWWLDNDTLLIGGAAWIDPSGPESNFTAKYVLRDATLHLISQVGSAQWAVNPVSGKVAYVTAETFDISESLSADSKVIVSTIVADTLSPERAFKGGCKAVWSLDGKQLVVLTYTTLSCLAGLKSIIFIDPDTGSQHYHEIALDRDVLTDFAQPVGWVRVS
ncbi:MAG: hypothetical protein KF716_30070 [Anaerolineae bacterium]|nr:hypothetical protein [Anaerolineae bacterium]